MKQLIAILIIIGSIAAARGAENTDSIIRFTNPDSVVVTTTDNSISVKINGDRYGQKYQYDYSSQIEEDNDIWEINLPFSNSENGRSKGKNYFSIDWFDNFYVGATFPLNGAAGINCGWEIGVDNIAAVRWNISRSGTKLSLGFGMGYRSANFGDEHVLAQADKVIYLTPIGSGIEKGSSRLHLFRLHVPLMLTQKVYKDKCVRVGAVLNLNTYLSATTKTQGGGVTSKASFHSLKQRFVTPDIFGSFNFFDGLGFYLRWSPMSVFEKGWGPDLDYLSIGLNIVI